MGQLLTRVSRPPRVDIVYRLFTGDEPWGKRYVLDHRYLLDIRAYRKLAYIISMNFSFWLALAGFRILFFWERNLLGLVLLATAHWFLALRLGVYGLGFLSRFLEDDWFCWELRRSRVVKVLTHLVLPGFLFAFGANGLFLALGTLNLVHFVVSALFIAVGAYLLRQGVDVLRNLDGGEFIRLRSGWYSHLLVPALTTLHLRTGCGVRPWRPGKPPPRRSSKKRSGSPGRLLDLLFLTGGSYFPSRSPQSACCRSSCSCFMILRGRKISSAAVPSPFTPR